MGCDIHGGVEWKWSDSTAIQPWGFLAPVPDIRSYDVFAVLADIRQYDVRLKSYADTIPLRGRPLMMTQQVADLLDVAQHSFTYYTLAELLASKHLFEQVEHDITRELWLTFLRYMDLTSRAWFNADVRLTIGFDN